MKKEDLFQAIGAVNDGILMESEGAIPGRSRPVVRRAVLIAAVIAMMVVSAAAAAMLGRPIGGVALDGFVDGRVEHEYLADGSKIYNVWLDVQANEDRPGEIETVYTLSVPDSWYTTLIGLQSEDNEVDFRDILAGDPVHKVTLQWYPDLESGDRIMRVMLIQQTLEVSDKGVLADSMWEVREGFEMSGQVAQLGGIQGYLMTVPIQPWENLNYHTEFMMDEKRFYWTDGDYLFTLIYSTGISDETVAGLLETLRAETDVTAYLNEITVSVETLMEELEAAGFFD